MSILCHVSFWISLGRIPAKVSNATGIMQLYDSAFFISDFIFSRDRGIISRSIILRFSISLIGFFSHHSCRIANSNIACKNALALLNCGAGLNVRDNHVSHSVLESSEKFNLARVGLLLIRRFPIYLMSLSDALRK